jgi:hypothetical protein
MSNRIRYGVHEQLEAMADALLAASLDGVTSREAKSDIMTPWKWKHRKTHEILTRSGAPVDPSTRRGQFSRAYNAAQTYLNSYDGPTRPIKMDSNWDPEVAQPLTSLSDMMAAVVGVDRLDY